jgi:hypothetical protein
LDDLCDERDARAAVLGQPPDPGRKHAQRGPRIGRARGDALARATAHARCTAARGGASRAPACVVGGGAGSSARLPRRGGSRRHGILPPCGRGRCGSPVASPFRAERSALLLQESKSRSLRNRMFTIGLRGPSVRSGHALVEFGQSLRLGHRFPERFREKLA